ncbi:hypothetical protein CsatB_002590 [Cannabis sativa]
MLLRCLRVILATISTLWCAHMVIYGGAILGSMANRRRTLGPSFGVFLSDWLMGILDLGLGVVILMRFFSPMRKVVVRSVLKVLWMVLAKCGLVDMGYEGARFTWCNKHTNGSFLQERLDRMVCSSSWHLMFSNSYVSHLKLWGSDHRPLLTCILRACESRRCPKQKGWFHFEMAWANDPGCREIIVDHWGSSESTDIGGVQQKIKGVSGALNDWNGMVFKRTLEAIRKKKKELEVLDSNLNDSNWLSYKKLEKELDILLYKDKKYWFSRAKNSLLKLGDKNSASFHQSATHRKKKNAIGGIFYKNNVWVKLPRGIAAVFEEYFSSLFTSHGPPDEVLNMVLDSIQPRLLPFGDQQI